MSHTSYANYQRHVELIAKISYSQCIPKPEILFCLFAKIVKFCVRIAEGNILYCC
jgi:hypothetical protein